MDTSNNDGFSMMNKDGWRRRTRGSERSLESIISSFYGSRWLKQVNFVHVYAGECHTSASLQREIEADASVVFISGSRAKNYIRFVQYSSNGTYSWHTSYGSRIYPVRYTVNQNDLSMLMMWSTTNVHWIFNEGANRPEKVSESAMMDSYDWGRNMCFSPTQRLTSLHKMIKG